MIIEFFGFPGSGKTTLSNELIHQLELKRIKVVRGTVDHLGFFRRVFLKGFYCFLCLFLNPSFWLKNLNIIFRYKSFRDFLNLTYLFARYTSLSQGDKLVVFDQGLLQAYWSIVTFTGYKNFNLNYLVVKLEKVVILKLDSEENFLRLSQREEKHSRSQNLNNPEEIKKQFAQFEIIVQKIVEQEQLNYELVDCQKTIEENVINVFNFINNY